MPNLLVAEIPGPVAALTPQTNLNVVKVNVALARLHTLQSVLLLQEQEIKTLRREVADLTALADELAAELEAVYGLQDQGACALAALAAWEVDDAD